MAYPPREVFCMDCKKLFVKKHAKTKRCPECQKAYNKARQREIYQERAKKTEMEKKKDPHICTRSKSCQYGGTLSGIFCCDYMLITGHRRPCPPKDCTEYKRRERGRRKNERPDSKSGSWQAQTVAGTA